MPTRKSVRQVAASKRAAAAALDAQAKYDAAGFGRRIKSWNPASSGPNNALEGFERLRNRSRDSVRNDWAGSSVEQKWTTTLIGTGIVPRWENNRISDLWEQSRSELDADGVADVYGLQALATRGFIGAGESFLRKRPRDLNAPLTAPVQVQLVEGDFCPRFDSDTWTGMPEGNTIRSGIERNKYGRRVAVWFYKSHPGDRPDLYTTPSMGDLVRVPISDVAQFYEPRRPGMLRGVSDLASVLTRLRATGNLEDAVLDRQLLANLFTMFVTKTLPTNYDGQVDQNTGLPVFYNRNGTPLVGLEPGMSQELLPGEDVKFANPPEPGVSHSDYLRTMGLGTSAGVGMPYELFSGDIREVGDRALRVLINEFRRYAEQRQWLWVIPQHCMPVVRWWAEALYLKGTFSRREYEEAIRPSWNPQGWEYIHPVQDVQGVKLAIETGLTSKTAAILKRGDDPRVVLKQREQDAKDEKAAGLVPPPAQPASPPTSGAKPPPDPAALMMSMATTISAQMAGTFEKALSSFADGVRAMSSQPRETHLHATVAAPNVAVENKVEPTPVHTTVNNVVEPTPVRVAVENKVEPTPVTIENTVEATLTMPPRESKTTVVYDEESGQIRESTTTETTIPLQ
jgi:lambda family phage portal protein